MTIRTQGTPTFVLDAGDFQFTFSGVTVGLKLSFIDTPTGPIATLVLVEKVGGVWKLQEELMGDFSPEVVKTKGVAAWLTGFLLPKLNAWLAKRFNSAPAPVPDWVPQILVDLDAALLSLKVVTGADGIPQVVLDT